MNSLYFVFPKRDLIKKVIMHPYLQLDQEITVEIQRLGINGEGIGYFDGLTVFVDGALPGEFVNVRLTQLKKNYCKGSLQFITHSSVNRATPPCPLYESCGGCQLMHLNYPSQCEMKRQRVIDALERIGKLEGIHVLPCIPSPSPLSYRNKIQVPIRPGKIGIEMGFNKQNSHDLVDMDFCHIHCPLGQSVYESIRKVLRKSKVTAYDWSTQKGELRYLIIKTALHTNQALVIFVTSGKATNELKIAAHEIMTQCREVKGIVQNINSIANNIVLGEKFFTLAGENFIQEKICGYLFKVSPSSFFQINPYQAEQLYKKVVEFAELQGFENVLDAFCGVGTLTLILSASIKQVIGVECVPGAIEDAKQNAIMNKVNNAHFICAPAEDYIQELKNIDVVILNPPRKGCEPVLLKKLGTLLPKKIIYVSCDPATLARDLKLLKNFGYTIDQIQPFDMFPQTSHVETVVRLVTH